ncbi:uncharacterized protein LOC103521522, partial [Diaphorina citri]|uniref:Uncharacterized protein LOC103521522 n=1 Tax=Diaphorina citri TaxID=121845 RepID=A0A1S3DN35_DIACI
MDDDFLVTSSSPTAVDYIGPQPSTSNTTNDVPHSELKKELWSLLEKSDLCSMSLKKLRLVLESKLNCDLSQRMLEFGEIVSSYLEELDKKKTAKILKDFDIAEYFPEIEMKNSLNSQSYDEFDSYPGFDALDVDFAFEPAIKSLEAIGGDLAVLENALGKGTGAVREKGDAVQSATGSAGVSKSVPGLVQSKSKDKDSNTGGSSKSKDKDSNTGGSASSGNSSVFMGTKSSN